MTTPSQLAKEFAAQHGFMIKPVERRYHVMRAGMPLTFVADVGGYPAALNAMRKWLDDMQASGESVVNIVDYDPGHKQVEPGKFNVTWGTLEPITPDTVPMPREEMIAPVKAEFEQLRQCVMERAKRRSPYPAIGLDATVWIKSVAAITQPVFDDFDTAAQARIRKAASRIARQRRKASDKPPGGPWRLTYNVRIAECGFTRADYNGIGYPSRSAALKELRYLLGSYLTHAYWRTVALTLEYRA